MNREQTPNPNAADLENELQAEGLLECQACQSGITINFNGPVIISSDSHEIIKVIAEQMAERMKHMHWNPNGERGCAGHD